MKKMSLMYGLVTLILLICACNNASESTSVTLDSSDSIQPLPVKNVRHEVCGIESYNSRTHSLCGVENYNNTGSAACGVAAYNARADIACAGSFNADQYENVTTTSCRQGGIRDPESCRAGYSQIRMHEKKETCCAGRQCEVEIENIVRKARVCDRAEHLATCRLEQFGVESYHACRHSSHGVESYNTCSKPEFGVALHKQCSFYLLPGEVDRFLTSVKELLPYMGETLVSSKAKYFLELDDEASMACHIARFDTDPLFTGQMGELKTLYTVRFGRDFLATRFDCSTTTVPDITQDTCADSDASRKCSSVRSYRGAKKWLNVKSTDLTNLKNDIAAKSDQAVSQAVTSSLDAINSYNK